MEYGLDNYEYRDVWQERSFSPVPVENGVPESGDLAEEAAVEISLDPAIREKKLEILLKEGEHVTVRYDGADRLKAPVREGDKTGKVVYSLNGETIASFPVTAKGTVGEITMRWCLEDVLEKYFLRSRT